MKNKSIFIGLIASLFALSGGLNFLFRPMSNTEIKNHPSANSLKWPTSSNNDSINAQIEANDLVFSQVLFTNELNYAKIWTTNNIVNEFPLLMSFYANYPSLFFQGINFNQNITKVGLKSLNMSKPYDKAQQVIEMDYQDQNNSPIQINLQEQVLTQIFYLLILTASLQSSTITNNQFILKLPFQVFDQNNEILLWSTAIQAFLKININSKINFNLQSIGYDPVNGTLVIPIMNASLNLTTFTTYLRNSAYFISSNTEKLGISDTGNINIRSSQYLTETLGNVFDNTSYTFFAKLNPFFQGFIYPREKTRKNIIWFGSVSYPEGAFLIASFSLMIIGVILYFFETKPFKKLSANNDEI